MSKQNNKHIVCLLKHISFGKHFFEFSDFFLLMGQKRIRDQPYFFFNAQPTPQFFFYIYKNKKKSKYAIFPRNVWKMIWKYDGSPKNLTSNQDISQRLTKNPPWKQKIHKRGWLSTNKKKYQRHISTHILHTIPEPLYDTN